MEDSGKNDLDESPDSASPDAVSANGSHTDVTADQSHDIASPTHRIGAGNGREPRVAEDPDSVEPGDAEPAQLDESSDFEREVVSVSLSTGSSASRSRIQFTVRAYVPWLLAILFLGAAFRLTGVNWDDNQHLHPDERFLTMVTTAIQLPASLDQYFDTAHNPMSPYNHQFGFYVYGTFPLYVVKMVGLWIKQSGYDEVTLFGRVASAFVDTLTILMVVMIGRKLYNVTVGLLGGALYAVAVLPIQLSHFYATDTFASFFATLAFYFSIDVERSGRKRFYVLSGLALGLAVGSKVSAGSVALVIGLAAAVRLWRAWKQYLETRDEPHLWMDATRTCLGLAAAAIIAFATFRVVQPIAFQGPGPLGILPNPAWIANMVEISDLQSGARDFPPGHQWTNRTPIVFPLSNMVVWGLGIPLGIAAWAGVAFAAYELLSRRKLAHLLPVTFVAVMFLYQGLQWVPSMRYFVGLYPFLCLLAAYGLLAAWRWAGQHADLTGLWRGVRVAARASAPVVLFLTAVWAAGFVTIYTRPHSRVDASRWIYSNVPKGAVLANEHWDDGLPLRIDGKDGFGGWYKGIELTNYDEDTPEKLNKLVDRLSQADYVILSSDRLYGSIPRLPMRYPMTTRYYEMLFSGELGYVKVAEFTSYPRLFGLIDIPDQGAEEAFTVYDHPKVDIYLKTPSFSAADVKSKLGDGIDWNNIQRLTPLQATRAKASLMLSPTDQTVYQDGGTWSALFNLDAWQNQLPVLAWVLVVELLGLVAAPLCLVVLRRLADGGYAVAKTLGMLLTAWLAWLLASARIVPFGITAVAIGLGIVAVISVVMLALRWRQVLQFIRTHWRLLLVEEAVFWLLFLGGLAIRYTNPDLWHPVLGGEKPMDFSFLNAVVKSTYFPPYDPWFAGGYINYYYFGFVMVASLIHLSGVAPFIAYNLAVPTLFALTGVGAFGAVYSLAAGWSSTQRLWRGRICWPGQISAIGAGLAAICGALFVAVVGNLAEVVVLVSSLTALSRVDFPTTVPPLLGLAKLIDGISQVLFGGKALPARIEWWYWNATRVIPHPQSEAGPINEFPFFTFLYADLHAHMMALPLTLVALTIAIAIIRDTHLPVGPNGVARAAAGQLRWLRDHWEEAALLALAGVVAGSLWPTNTWDLPTYAGIIGGALAVREIWRRKRVDVPMLVAVAWRLAVVLAVGYLAFLPFQQSNVAAYTSIELWRGSHTTLDAYLLMHGLFLFVITTYLFLEARHGLGHNLGVRLIRLYALRWGESKRLGRRRRRLVHESPLGGAVYSVTRFALFALAWLALLDHGPVALASILLVLALALLASPAPEPRRQLVLLLMATGLALTIAVEVVVLKGDISRMNTVFKFYMQVWVLWGVATAAALPIIAERLRPAPAEEEYEPDEEPAQQPSEQAPALEPAESTGTAIAGAARSAVAAAGLRADPPATGVSWWWSVFAILVAASLLYPVLATTAKVRDRFDTSVGSTLDGTAFMTKAVYQDQNRNIVLEWDRQAIFWLLQNVPGSPVIAEANTPLYRWGSRVAMFTGLPDVVGWDWHERQQRGSVQDAALNKRLADVKTIFSDSRPEPVVQLLKQYGVRYVYVGEVERAYYPAAGLNKFDRYAGTYWDLVYENEQVHIYRVRE